MRILYTVIASLLFFVSTATAQTVGEQISRTTCTAPCTIHGNVDLYASGVSERRNHDYWYACDFDDTGAGTWVTGASKETDQGPVFAHVYESAGTYNIVCTAYSDATTEVVAESFAAATITVTAADTTYSTINTTCVNTSGDSTFTDCPSGANQVQTNDISTLTGYVDAGERLLFKRGSSWTISSANVSWPNNTGPVTIGAYGTCTSPDSKGVCSNAPQITISGSATHFIEFSNKRDWRVEHLYLTAATTVDHAIGGAIDYKNILIAHNKIVGFENAIEMEHWKSDTADLIDMTTFYENDISGSNVINAYVGAERLAMLGNEIYDAKTSHAFRIWQSYLGVVNHNISSGASIDNTAGRHALKMHGPWEAIIGTAGTGNQLAHRTSFTVVRGNIFGSSGYWPVSIGAQNTAEQENLSDIIFEKNKVIADYGTQSATGVTKPVVLGLRYGTFRNNILNGLTTSAKEFKGFHLYLHGVELSPLGNEFYNNTIYSTGTHSNDQAIGFVLDANCDDTIIRNNLVSFPNSSVDSLIADASPDLISSNNLLTDTPYFTDPDNVTPLSRDFSVTSSGTASIDQGYAVPVFDDFIGTSRPQNSLFDIGAYEYYALTRSIGKFAPSRAFIK